MKICSFSLEGMWVILNFPHSFSVISLQYFFAVRQGMMRLCCLVTVNNLSVNNLQLNYIKKRIKV